MSVRRQTTSMPASWPSPRIASASRRASSCVRMNAPSPTFTSRTSALAPHGDLLRHDAGGDQRDLVDRRRHVAQRIELPVGRHEVGGLAARPRCRSRAPARRAPRSRARRGSPESTRACRACHLCGRGRGRSSSRTARHRRRRPARRAIVALSPTPPVECLSTTRRPRCAARSTVSPLATIASVSANVSAAESPRNQIAMSSAAAW